MVSENGWWSLYLSLRFDSAIHIFKLTIKRGVILLFTFIMFCILLNYLPHFH